MCVYLDVCISVYLHTHVFYVDIDECSISNDRTCKLAENTRCVNRPGTYACVCINGFKRTATGCNGENHVIERFH